MSVKEKRQLKEKLERVRVRRLRHRRELGAQAAPPDDPERLGFGAFADDDPELHGRFADGEFDEELIDAARTMSRRLL